MEHVRLIDSLRGFAAILVLVSHVAFWTGASNVDLVGRWLARGDSGVAVFFAISAFLLLSPAYIQAFSPEVGALRDWKSYAYRRAARILPAYWLALVAVLGVAAVLNTPEGLGDVRKILIHVVLGQALFGEQYQGFSQTWSLTTEVSFYVLVPVLSLWIIRTVRSTTHRFRFAIATLLLAAGLGIFVQLIAWVLAGQVHHVVANALGTSVLGHMAWFAAGASVAALIHAHHFGALSDSDGIFAQIGLWLLSQSRATLLLLAVAVFAIAGTRLAGPHDLSEPQLYEALLKESLYAVFAFLLLLVVVKPIARGSALDGYANSGLNEWFGNTSYGVFLWHLVVLQVVFAINGSTLFNAHFGWTLQLVVTITAIIASASWYLVEKPIVHWVRKKTTSGQESTRL